MRSRSDDPGVGSRDLALVRAEQDLALSRDQVARSIMELQREVARVVDWRAWIRRKPLVAVSVAFGLGLLLGRRN
jgi:hypothetical protein